MSANGLSNQAQAYLALLSYILIAIGVMTASIPSQIPSPLKDYISFGLIMLGGIGAALKEWLGDPTTGQQAPSTPSTIPTIPPVPATVFITGSVTVSSVTVDNAPYSSAAALKAGNYTSLYDSAEHVTLVAIAFPDYNPHSVTITFSTGTWNGTLQAGQVLSI